MGVALVGVLLSGGAGLLLGWFDGEAPWPAGVQIVAPGAYPGYTLFAPNTLGTTYLVDLDGEVVHRWESPRRPALSVRLLDNGDLLRPSQLPVQGPFNHGGRGGQIDRVAWDGSVMWSVRYGNRLTVQHHDVELLPNGNLLLIAWEFKTPAEGIGRGRASSTLLGGGLWPDAVIEIEPTTNTVVWEWHAWDHLIQDRSPAKPNYGVVADHPGRININYGAAPPDNPDWLHTNSIDYNAELDQILLSVREFDEIWIIDHSITTEEAAGPKGDLLFRWGNPAASDQGRRADRRLFRQHNAEWVPPGMPGAGNITVFNNGVGRGYSSVEELTTVWEHGRYRRDSQGYFAADVTTIFGNRSESRFYASLISGAQRLPNGNTLVTDGTAGRAVEIDPGGGIVWEYYSPYSDGSVDRRDGVEATRLFRAQRYGLDYPGLRGTGLGP